MQLHIVHKTVSGYAREDAPQSSVIGVYTDSAIAEKVRLVSQAEIEVVELNHIAPGILQSIEAFGFKI